MACANTTNGFAPGQAAYSSQLIIKYDVGVTETDIKYLTESESFYYCQPPALYYDKEFADRVVGAINASDPGLGAAAMHPSGGNYTFSSDLSEGEEFYIRAPLAEFMGKIDPVIAEFDSQGKALATINGEPWMELTITIPEKGEVSARPFTVDVEFLIEGLYPLLSATLGLQDGRQMEAANLNMRGDAGSYWHTGGVMEFNAAVMFIKTEGAYITFREASERIVETAEPEIIWKGKD